ncbi:transcription elongation factor GreA [Xiamenia xianingshaonis]|uniref:Transcription elongation factor GreA n=1 Tax=Xiamenia xianingshaonis TaxID=2682776 RepID=A0A9E6MQU9_9ACTN|nr:transcription elongation factor GreA [Xiamenia xianingshaonis]NGM17528.1 transcription elongation factor GreA [Eggerthellaceae bacterium zg-893]NHM13201.1 transcription elongation factor GreA [Xiamenia xianingshaonis]NHM15425.1 transcription elongation factor GreA [Xiamenia xianingshaonis]QTU84707.1 transcription elongation factor GreA [Xiamenia xianingshaonis]
MASNSETILTEEGKKKLEEELDYLETTRRAEVGERIRVAREFGDISENSEYDDAKNEQGMLEARINEINQILSNATVVSTPKRGNSVHIGSTVSVVMNGKPREITIVGAAESDPGQNKISNEAPVGAAILGKRVGDVINLTGPTGLAIEIEIKALVKKDN